MSLLRVVWNYQTACTVGNAFTVRNAITRAVLAANVGPQSRESEPVTNDAQRSGAFA